MSRTRGYDTISLSLLFMTALLLVVACTPIPTSSPHEESTVIPSKESAIEMTPTLPALEDPRLQLLIEGTKADLASRLAIEANQISLGEILEVEWSDSSLDCPQPGMEYLQVITPGYRIVLEAGGQSYEYHTNRNTYFVYCENQILPDIPRP